MHRPNSPDGRWTLAGTRLIVHVSFPEEKRAAIFGAFGRRRAPGETLTW
ncbi:MAG: hypothetical protein ACRDP6_09900 [Actinoallomurus sp.]